MLILHRKCNEQIVIGGNGAWPSFRIVVTVVEIRGNAVRLGIDAPRNISVHRREVQDEIDQEKRNE